MTKEEQKARFMKELALKMEKAGRSPLSFSQERIWSITRLNPENNIFNIHNSIRIKGKPDLGLLEKSLNEIVKRHEILHSIFLVEKERPVQLVLPFFRFKLKTQTITSADTVSLEQIVSEIVKHPFHLHKDMPFRAVLLKQDQDNYILILVMHQIVIDAESWGIIFQELAGIYDAWQKGIQPSLPYLALQYADYARWQRERLTGESYTLLTDYWHEHFKESIVPMILPSDRFPVNHQTTAALTCKFEIGQEILQKSKGLCRQEKTSLFTALLSAFNCLLYMYTLQEKFLVFTSVSSKDRPELKALIGLFSNLVPLQVRITQNLNLKQVLKSMQKEVNTAIEHQDLPFEKIKESIKIKLPEQKTGYASLLQVMFIFRYGGASLYDLDNISLERVDILPDRDLAFQVRLLMVELENRIVCNFQYNASCYDESTIKRIAGHYITLLDICFDHPELPLAELLVFKSITAHSEELARKRDRGVYNDTGADFVMPVTPEEKKLTRIWQEIFNTDKIGIKDNFFFLGGDSLLALRMIDKAKEENIHLNPSTVVSFPTIYELARKQDTFHSPLEDADTGGNIQLSYNQYWYLFNMESRIQPERWNLNYLYETSITFNPELLKKAVKILMEYHEALRSRFVKTDSFYALQFFESGGEIPFYLFDFSALPESEQKQEIEKTTDDLQNRFDLFKGPLFLVALINLGKDKSQRLFFTAHHLIADNYSVEILFRDLKKVYECLATGQNFQLPFLNANLKQYGILLNGFAKSPDVGKETGYWLNLPWDDVAHLPVDLPGGKAHNYIESEREVAITLESGETEALLRNVSSLKVQFKNLLLMTLVSTLSDWAKKTWVEINVIESGRTIPGHPEMDFSHTVGFLALTGLMILKKMNLEKPEEEIRAFEEYLETIPDQGRNFYLLLYLYGDKEVFRKLLSSRRHEVLFNFIGKQENVKSMFGPAHEDPGLREYPKNLRFTLVDCVCAINSSRLLVRWVYSENVHKKETIEKLAEHYIGLLRRFI